MSKTPNITLVVLDGFGLSPATRGNAIYHAQTPTLNALIRAYPFVALKAHGTEVGLTWGEMGSSEVGHLNIGAGRVVVQDVTRITRSIDDGSFADNKEILSACQRVKDNNGSLHIIGLASPGGVHGHIKYIEALLEVSHNQGIKDTYLHLISDGRDTEPRSIKKFLPRIERARKKYGGTFATIAGRYWAMDRDRRWDRTKAAYNTIVHGTGKTAVSIEQAIEQAYANDESDEFITPTVIDGHGQPVRIKENDEVIFTNHRPDRARQLARAFAGKNFEDFTRERSVGHLVTFTNYGVELEQSSIAFNTEPVTHQLADVLDRAGLRQFHIGETEKYAHVTYFFNGYIEQPFTQEKRQLVASPQVETYDTTPAMSADTVTSSLLDAYTADSFDVAIVNYANADMVGHTGNFDATVQAVEVIDAQLQRITERMLPSGDIVCVTADHGNAEQLIHPDTGDIDKEHTANPVPFLLLGHQYKRDSRDSDPRMTFFSKAPVGILGDIAPTLLELLGLDAPEQMTGQSLLTELERS